MKLGNICKEILTGFYDWETFVSLGQKNGEVRMWTVEALFLVVIREILMGMEEDI